MTWDFSLVPFNCKSISKSRFFVFINFIFLFFMFAMCIESCLKVSLFYFIEVMVWKAHNCWSFFWMLLKWEKFCWNFDFLLKKWPENVDASFSFFLRRFHDDECASINDWLIINHLLWPISTELNRLLLNCFLSLSIMKEYHHFLFKRKEVYENGMRIMSNRIIVLVTHWFIWLFNIQVKHFKVYKNE